MIRFNFKKHLLKFCLSALILTSGTFYNYYKWQTPNLRVYYLDVGQGNAELIRSADGLDILIDGGPDNEILAELGKVRPVWDRTIEYVILTHPHLDHFYGLTEVLRRYQVDHIYYNGLEPDNQYFKEFKSAMEVSGAEVIIPDHYVSLALNDGDIMEIINPLPEEIVNADISDGDGKEINDSSLAIRFTHGLFRSLIVGDIESGQEAKLLEEGGDLLADVLLSPHHGSKSSSSEPFLKAVNPELIIISAGAHNSYHHPHPSTLSRYQELNIPFLRTDKEGVIMIESDGNGYWRGKY